MNKDILTARMRESQALDALIRILLLFIVAMVAFSAGYCHAANEAAQMVRILINQQ
jgi:phosphate/sulfate permease